MISRTIMILISLQLFIALDTHADVTQVPFDDIEQFTDLREFGDGGDFGSSPISFGERFVGQTTTFKPVPIRPNEIPETWAPDFVWGEKGEVKTWDWISPMGRVGIVEDLSGTPVGSGEVALKIRDDDCAWNNRSFSFSAEKGILQVTPAKDYDCEITIQGLSAIVYGGHLLEDFPYRKWGVLSKDMITRITALFPPKLPYLHADL